MPLVEISNSKGLVQKSGSGLVALPKSESAQALSGNGQKIDTSGFYVKVDAGGEARTGTILEEGTVDGQLLLLANVGGEKITFNADGAVSYWSAGAIGPAAGESVLCVWDHASSLWRPTSQSLA